MDTTHGLPSDPAGTADGLLEELATVDPADAPEVAERLARTLSVELDAASGEGHR
ncbi:MAG TPA: hypothetical protein VLG28_02915 [Acidimicrobiia bacterium]|nr:hypothetical protein [Acidimicrobiia bacterium]